ncbi:MAG: prolyl oligopeptidase family serine peptidase [Planctomycetaceae bacterium]|nr:prolyl oligopeptidase family serine peptidase [Planctomycetaceae bacterium]
MWSAFLVLLSAGGALPQVETGPVELANAAPRVESWLVLSVVDARGRRPFREEAVFGRHLLDPAAAAPVEDESVRGSLGREAWQRRATAESGGPEGGGFGSAYGVLDVAEDEAGVYVVALRGAFDLWIDGTPLAGDGYGYGLRGAPVLLDAGEHRVFVSGVRGGFGLVFERAEPGVLPLVADVGDAALPHIAADNLGREVAVGLPLVSLAPDWLGELTISVGPGGDFEEGPAGSLAGFAPFGSRRAALVVVPRPRDAVAGTWRLPLVLELAEHEGAMRLELLLEGRNFGDPRLSTYRSSVDGAVLPYGVLAPSDQRGPKGLVLSLHGASVSADAQIRSYSPQQRHWIAAPTNRRPFGFDWQDWGRRDAVEVVRAVEGGRGLDITRRAVTGHSMGGHGTWHMAAFDAGAFAAAAPSAGWQSFDTYGGPRPSGARAELWRAADRGSETALAIDAIARLPIFVLHGDADDNVPPSEARAMLALLEGAGATKVGSHFQPGAGHWWDGERARGADCLEWPALMATLMDATRDTLAQFVRWPLVGETADVSRVVLERPDGYSFDERWLEVVALVTPGVPGRYEGRLARSQDVLRVALATEGIAALELRPPETGGLPRRFELELDGTLLTVEGPSRGAPTWLARGDDGVWSAAVADGLQRPGRSGPFKRVFDRRPALVVGTGGTAAESAALLELARFDAQRWNVRAAGELEVVRDADVFGEVGGARFAGRNLVLYGNRDNNLAWAQLVPRGGPFDARRGAMRVLGSDGEYREFEGESLAAFAVRPRVDGNAEGALVGLVAASDVPGARLAHLSAWIVSGVGLPDFAIYDASVLSGGDEGVRAAGWWSEDWNRVR